MAEDHWTKLQQRYRKADWITQPSLFAETVKDYLPKKGSLLELGAGVGQDSVYFADLGYEVTATDLSIDRLQESVADKCAVQPIDMRQRLPFADASFDIVYAHLSLHYFDQKTTEQLFSEIYRVVKVGGVLAFFTNSTDDPEYTAGKQIEDGYVEINGVAKRFLNITSAQRFAQQFKPLLLDNNGETYKDRAIGVHHLIRFIGTKA